MCSINGGSELGALVLVDQALETLRAAARLPLGGAVSDVELTQLMQRLEAVARVAKGGQAEVIREIGNRQAHRGQAAGSTSDLLARTLRLSPGEARREAELADGLAALPDTQQALADGRIGVGQAQVAVKKAAEVKDRDDAQELLAKIDQTAATVGQQVDRNRLAREIDGELAKSNMDVLADRERTAFARRSLTWTVRDGMHVLHAELDPVGGSTVRAMLDRLSTKTDERDTRSFSQRQTDALVHMATLAKGNEGKPQTTLQSARILLAALRSAGPCGTATRTRARTSRASRGARRVRRASREPGRGCSRSGSGRADRCGAHRRPHARRWAAPEVRHSATTRHAAGAATPTSTNTAGRSPNKAGVTAPAHHHWRNLTGLNRPRMRNSHRSGRSLTST